MNPSPTVRNPAARAVVWGASGHASVVEDCARTSGAYSVVGFIDELHPERRGERVSRLPILGGREALDAARRAGVSHVLLGVGNNQARLRIADDVVAAGMELGTVIHPTATVAHSASLGPGVVVVAGAIVGPEATVGRAALINTSSSVDHHCRIGAGAHIAPGALLAGGVEIGELAWIGIGAIVIERVRVGDGAFVGAGALVLRDLPAGTMAYGLPARPVRPTSTR
ncbi:MAG TPA: acetyltransferase [Polyangiaceae bacterium]|nr:acetyltransferase [Polyangiaceae bacterium]